MKCAYCLAAAIALQAGAVGAAQPAQPQPAQPLAPAAPPAPWANKMFLPDIAANPARPAPPAILHDFGEVPHGTLCSHTFKITNIYDVPLQITQVRTSCTCLDFTSPSGVLQPNEVGEMTVTMNTAKFVGANTQKFFVSFGPKFESSAVIQVRAYSRTEVMINPGAVRFGTVAQGAKAAQEFKVEYKGRARDWKVTEVVAKPDLFDVKVVEASRGGPLRGGAEYLVTVGLKPTAPAGPIAERIALKTNDASNPLIEVAVSAVVGGPVEFAPNKVRIDGVPVGQAGQVRVYVRATRPFKIEEIKGTDDVVSVERVSTEASVPVHVLTVNFKPTAVGVVTRELRIRTSLDSGAVAVLPVEAVGVK